MSDVNDQGTVYNPKTQPGDAVGDQDDAISGVRELQIVGPYIFGGFDSDYSKHFGQNSPSANRYFLLDTRKGKQVDFDTEGQLRDAASRSGAQLRLEPDGLTPNPVIPRFRWHPEKACRPSPPSHRRPFVDHRRSGSNPNGQ
jgi:hypothetical protein